MTNRERLAQASNTELAKELCSYIDNCEDCCPAYDLCGKENGILKWLEMEDKDGT